jgi:hypothetical protein
MVAALACPRAARADAADAERRAAAQALFDEAKRLTEAHKEAEACPKLYESYKLDPAMGTKFYLARCYEAIGKLASAWSFYLEVVDDAHKEGAADKEKFANDRAAALKPRLPRLTVSVLPDARRIGGLSVKRDGIPVGEGSWDTPLPVDLGDHVVTATAPGRKDWESHVVAKEEAGTVRVEVPVLEALPAPRPDPVARPVEPRAPNAPPPVSRWTTKQAIAGYVVGGVGVVGVGIGLGFGASAMSKVKESNANGCTTTPDVCTPAGRAIRVDAINAATTSTAFFVAGAVVLAAGVVVVLTTPTPKAPSAVTTGLRVGPGGGAFVGAF